jgi:hypothetical protein
MFFWILLWLAQVFIQMWKHIEYYNLHHDYVDGFEGEKDESEDESEDDEVDTDIEEEVEEKEEEEEEKEEEEEEEEKVEEENVEEPSQDLLTEEEFVREFTRIIKRNIDDGNFVYDDAWLYQSLRREIN